MATRSRFYIEANATEQLLSTEQAKAVVRAVAEAATRRAVEIQPNLTGEHDQDLITEDPRIEDGVAKCGYGSKSPSWHIMEFGSVHNPPFRPLTRAAQELGLRFDPS